MKLKYEDIKMNLRIVLYTYAFKEIQKMAEAKGHFSPLPQFKKSSMVHKRSFKGTLWTLLPHRIVYRQQVSSRCNQINKVCNYITLTSRYSSPKGIFIAKGNSFN